MRKQLNGLRRSSSRFTSAHSVVQAEWQVPMPGDSVRSYEDLTVPQQRFYDKVAKYRQGRILNDWKGIIEQYLEYRKPFLVDAYQLNRPEYRGRCPDLYVLPVFMPAGKHTYLVKNQDTFQYTMHTTICDFRTEDPPVLIKELAHKQSQRVFRKEHSVFDPWKEDTKLSLQLACESDMSNCKLAKAIRDPLDLTATYDVIYRSFEDLKLLFLQEACHSSYPFILQTDF